MHPPFRGLMSDDDDPQARGPVRPDDPQLIALQLRPAPFGLPSLLSKIGGEKGIEHRRLRPGRAPPGDSQVDDRSEQDEQGQSGQQPRHISRIPRPGLLRYKRAGSSSSPGDVRTAGARRGSADEAQSPEVGDDGSTSGPQRVGRREVDNPSLAQQ